MSDPICRKCASQEHGSVVPEECTCGYYPATPTPLGDIAEPYAWLCNGSGDGWKETDKIVSDPELARSYMAQPKKWTVEPLYRGSPPPQGDIAELVERLLAPWDKYEGKREILCNEAATSLTSLQAKLAEAQWDAEHEHKVGQLCAADAVQFQRERDEWRSMADEFQGLCKEWQARAEAAEAKLVEAEKTTEKLRADWREANDRASRLRYPDNTGQ